MNDDNKHSQQANAEPPKHSNTQAQDETADLANGDRRRAPNVDPDATLVVPPTASSPLQPSTAGVRYQVLRPHAKGGLGEVFVARDCELNREVALKEIQRQHADDPGSRSRFVLEAEITGGLEHPGIVPVYGLGQYGDGRPYYAMRFIRGDSLQEAVDQFHKANVGGDPAERTLQLRKLLGRFIDVCNAIQYAHARGVLHRDLKPSNIMLGKYGETLVVDWGLAKVQDCDDEPTGNGETALRPSSGGGVEPTQIGSAIGTPAFMPPEQAAGRLDELGPASDVYSLGATLYYVLTGKPPFRGKKQRALLDQVQQGDFPRPREVQPDVPKPLEAICLRAMATKPDGRYASPQELADDVERYLADEPVAAHTEPLSLRARRWLRKHPKSVASLAATVLAGLISSSVIAAVVSHNNDIVKGKNQQLTTVNTKLDLSNRNLDSANTQLVQKNDELEEANEAERLAKQEANSKRREAEKRLAQIKKGNEILGSTFADLDPRAEEKEGKTLRVLLGERLDRATEQLEGEAVGDPLAVAQLQHTLGRSQLGLGFPEKAILLFTKARATRTGELGSEHPHTLTSMGHLAGAYQDAGKLDQALPLLEETLKLRKAKLGPEHPDTLNSMNNLASLFWSMKDLDRSIPLFEKTLKKRISNLGQDHPSTLATKANLGVNYRDAGRLNEAIRLLEEVHQIGRKHASLRWVAGALLDAYVKAGKTADGTALIEESLRTGRKNLPADSPQLAGLLAANSFTLLELQAWQAAETYLRECLTIREKSLPERWPTFNTKSLLGGALAGRKKFKEAEPLLIAGYQGIWQREATIPAAVRICLSEALGRLIDLYTAWEKPKEAAKWQAELDKRQAAQEDESAN